MEKSIFMLKPEAMNHKEEILSYVEDKDAIENRKKICGTKIDGAVCEIDSVRNMFRDLAERDTFKYHKNIIHRAMGQKEVDDRTIIFFPETKS